MKKVSGSDWVKLDEYFNSVCDVEKLIEYVLKFDLLEFFEMDLFEDILGEYQVHVCLMYDIQLLVFQIDFMCISLFMLGNVGSNCIFFEVDVCDGYYSFFYYCNEVDKMEQFRCIDWYQVEQFVWFLGCMKLVMEGDVMLLDNFMILYGSAIFDGNWYNYDDLLIIFVGKGVGTIDIGCYVKFEFEIFFNNLFLVISECMGVGLIEFGDSIDFLFLNQCVFVSLGISWGFIGLLVGIDGFIMLLWSECLLCNYYFSCFLLNSIWVQIVQMKMMILDCGSGFSDGKQLLWIVRYVVQNDGLISIVCFRDMVFV